MLPNRLKDLEAEYHYNRYQLETLCGDVWTKGMIYACPPGKLSLLLTALCLTRTARLIRVNTDHVDMALVTDTILVPVIV